MEKFCCQLAKSEMNHVKGFWQKSWPELRDGLKMAGLAFAVIVGICMSMFLVSQFWVQVFNGIAGNEGKIIGMSILSYLVIGVSCYLFSMIRELIGFKKFMEKHSRETPLNAIANYDWAYNQAGGMDYIFKQGIIGFDESEFICRNESAFNITKRFCLKLNPGFATK